MTDTNLHRFVLERLVEPALYWTGDRWSLVRADAYCYTRKHAANYVYFRHVAMGNFPLVLRRYESQKAFLDGARGVILAGRQAL